MIPIVAPLLAACAPLGAPSVQVPDAVVLGRPYDEANAFARIIRGELHQAKVYEDRRVVAFMDYSPASPGHVLVISKTSRARNLLEMRDGDVERLMRVARRVGRAEIGGLGADGFTIEQNNAYSQSVPHLHVHVIPRYLGYNRCPGSGLRQPPEVLESFAARIRVAYAADTGVPVPPKPADDLPAPAVAPPTPQTAVRTDASADMANPADMVAFQLPSHGAMMNAVLYRAAGSGPHPTVLLLHGFPGNEQNLDLAQAIRRAGWNVLTLHYRGSWGSQGAFSFTHAAEDAAAALAWLRSPAGAVQRVDRARIVAIGHSMGGMMAARAAADDRGVIGAALIDPWDIAAAGRGFADPAVKRRWIDEASREDLPPLAGTSAAALAAEAERAGPTLDLALAGRALADRPLLVLAAARGIGAKALAPAEAARAAGGTAVTALTMPTDHSFSDSRIALQTAVLDWLLRLPR